jgi:class 3 adenylate cyclase
MGDGFMASFGSATKALECAIAIQRALAERNESAEEPMNVRVGLNAGEPASCLSTNEHRAPDWYSGTQENGHFGRPA